MKKSSNDGVLDVFTLSDRSLYRWLDSQDAGWHDMPEEQEFSRLESAPRGKRLARIKQKIRSLLAKRRQHVYQPI